MEGTMEESRRKKKIGKRDGQEREEIHSVRMINLSNLV
jgi:hypothetical protein